jgi:hypothetical protein
MFYRTQLQKYVVEWIRNQPKNAKFHVCHIQDYLANSFPLECLAAGNVPSGEAHYLNDARQAIRKCRSFLRKCRNGRWKRGWWQRI